MRFIGIDFSAARPPNMFAAWGRLEDRCLVLERVARVNDALELVLMCQTEGEALWVGIDCPMSCPPVLMERLGAQDWQGLLALAAQTPRADFVALLDAIGHELGDPERKCVEQGLCRYTERAVKSYGVLKRINPNLRPMFHSGLQVVYTLRRLGARVYPYDTFAHNPTTCLMEVYPSYTWQSVGLHRSLDVDEFAQRFNASGRSPVLVDLSHLETSIQTQDMADALIACVTVATSVLEHGLDADWQSAPSFATPEEWHYRHIEGLIVRLHNKERT